MVLPIASGVVLALAYPPLDLGWVAFIGLVPFWLHLSLSRRLGEALRGGYLFGVIFYLQTLRFLHVFGWLPWVVTSLYEALFPMFFGGLVWAVGRRRNPRVIAWVWPAAWVVIEWLRSVGPLGLTWTDLAYSQHRFLLYIQAADLVGPYGLTLAIAAVNGALVSILLAAGERLVLRSDPAPPKPWLRRAKGRVAPLLRRVAKASRGLPGAIGIAATANIAILLYGIFWMLQPAPAQRRIHVAVLQPGMRMPTFVGRDSRQTPEEEVTILQQLLDERSEGRADLVIWPESAIGTSLDADPRILPRLQRYCRRRHFDLLLGAQEPAPGGRTYNSAFLIRRDGRPVEPYRKNRLVAFGEYLPFRRYLAPLLKAYPIRSRDVAPGKGYQGMRLSNAGSPAGPEPGRQMARSRAHSPEPTWRGSARVPGGAAPWRAPARTPMGRLGAASSLAGEWRAPARTPMERVGAEAPSWPGAYPPPTGPGGYPPISVAPIICFESLFPRSARLAAQKADILVVLTNDGWFQRTTAAEFHANAAVLRAVENRKLVIQAAATGISMVVPMWGGSHHFRTKLLETAVLESRSDVWTLPPSFYSLAGDFIVWLCAGIVLWATGWCGRLLAIARGKGTSSKEASGQRSARRGGSPFPPLIENGERRMENSSAAGAY